MKKRFMVMLVALLGSSNPMHSLFSVARQFAETLHAFEESGGKNGELQKKLCGLGIARLNELREEILKNFPALRSRKNAAEFELSRLARAQKGTLAGKEAKKIKSQKANILQELTDIEDEIEAQLHARPHLSKEFDNIHNILKEWCD